MKAFALLGALLLVVVVSIQFSTMYKAKVDLQSRVEYRLDLVDETSMDSVKQDLIADAAKLGVHLTPANIDLVYADTEILSYAQRVVGRKLHVPYKNKQVAINVEYDAHIIGFPVHQRATASKIKQVSAPEAPTSKAAQEVLDSTE